MLHDSCLQESNDVIIWHTTGYTTSVLDKAAPNRRDKCPVHCENSIICMLFKQENHWKWQLLKMFKYIDWYPYCAKTSSISRAFSIL